jgi:hypothetical protein
MTLRNTLDRYITQCGYYNVQLHVFKKFESKKLTQFPY